MNTKTFLTEIAAQNGLHAETLFIPDCELDPTKIKTVMINEVPPKIPDDWFYSAAPDPENMKTAIGLFAAAGLTVKDMADINAMGIYITVAVKSPKIGYFVEDVTLRSHLPLLKAELSLFPNLRVIMCMGDVAKKAFNAITKAETGKNVIPSKPTGGIRHNEYFWGGIRVFPSYIMTGKNLLIEPFKRDCVADDIRRMTEFIK
jgi:hypothetical protein